VGAKSGSRLKKKKTIESFSREKEVISNTREKEEKKVKSKKGRVSTLEIPCTPFYKTREVGYMSGERKREWEHIVKKGVQRSFCPVARLLMSLVPVRCMMACALFHASGLGNECF
jgi:hypothetical protein